MPAKSEKQRNFFGVVEGAKHGEKGVSGKAKKVAKEMPEKKVKEFLKVEGSKEEDEQSALKQFKPKGKVKAKPKKVKRSYNKISEIGEDEEIKFGSVKKTKKTKGKDLSKIRESKDLSEFVESVMLKNYSDAKQQLSKIIDGKISNLIRQHLNTPLFTK